MTGSSEERELTANRELHFKTAQKKKAALLVLPCLRL